MQESFFSFFQTSLLQNILLNLKMEEIFYNFLTKNFWLWKIKEKFCNFLEKFFQILYIFYKNLSILEAKKLNQFFKQNFLKNVRNILQFSKKNLLKVKKIFQILHIFL